MVNLMKSVHYKVIVIDAGHGGHDPGATGNGYREKDLVLKMALWLQKNINSRTEGVKVVLTRSTDTFVQLAERSRISDRASADYFLSIHFNSAGVNTAQGIETFAYTKSSMGRLNASVINGAIVNKGLALRNRGVKSANFSVLRRTKATANLLETCFINNRSDINNFIKNYDEYMETLFQSLCRILEVTPDNGNKVVEDKPSYSEPENTQDSNFAWGKWDKGEAVVDIQKNLKVLGYDPGDTDGYFGEDTEKAVKDFQTKNKLKADGLVGSDTLNKIKSLVSKKDEETKPTKPDYVLEKNKLNIMLIGELVATEGFIEKGVSYISINDVHLELREIFEAMNLDVTWDNDLKIIEINTSGKFIEEEGLTEVIVLGSKINIKTFMHEDKHCLRIRSAYVPVREIFEALGFKVKWEDKKIVIKK